MIVFLTSSGHHYTHAILGSMRGAPHTQTMSYTQLFSAPQVPKATYVFTDFDRLSPSRHLIAAKAYRVLNAANCICLNDPARTRLRYALLKRLHAAGINKFGVYRVEAAEFPERYPVFLRSETGHSGALTDTLPDRDALLQEIERLVAAGYPEHTLIAVEYMAEPIRPSLFRTYKMFRVANWMLAHPSEHERTWAAKAR